jgi:hypothetical protein
MSDLVTAIGLAIAIEGLLYALVSGGMRRRSPSCRPSPPRICEPPDWWRRSWASGVVWLIRG